MRNLIALSLAVSVTMFSTPAQTATNTSHCKAAEKIVFSCSVGQKIVSICASSKLSPKSGYLQYRFGPKGATELLQPDPATSPKTAATAKAFPYSGGGGAYMRFTKGVYSYIVYSGIGKGWEQEGVAVEKGGKLIANLICKEKAISDSDPEIGLGPGFFEKFGIPEDEQEFDIPVQQNRP